MTFARLFKFRVLPGRETTYADYLKTVVTPIDDAAHKKGVFERLFTLTPENAEDWNHGRIFLYRDRAQRDAFAAQMAACAGTYDGSADETAKRKAYAETLRSLVEVCDFEIQ
jgi:hypothetical protein